MRTSQFIPPAHLGVPNLPKAIKVYHFFYRKKKQTKKPIRIFV